MIAPVSTNTTFDEAVAMAREVSVYEDQARWIYGDAACMVASEYGQATLERFAEAINQKYSAVCFYRQMSSFYEISARAEILETYSSLTYSHLRYAMQASNDINIAKSIIKKAHKRQWSVRRMEQVLRRWKPSNRRGSGRIGEWVANVHSRSGRMYMISFYGENFTGLEGKQVKLVAYKLE